jgi:hypothetical protein
LFARWLGKVLALGLTLYQWLSLVLMAGLSVQWVVDARQMRSVGSERSEAPTGVSTI